MQIIRRSRVGNDSEDVTLFSSLQTRGGTVAVLDGYDVINPQTIPPLEPPPVVRSAPTPTPLPTAQAAAAQTAPAPIGRPSPRLFNVLGLGTKASPRGMTYATSKNLFVFNDPIQPAKLFFADARGIARGSVDIQYPNGQPNFVEGLAYIPATVRPFPDTVVMVGNFNDNNSPTGIQCRLEFINLDGKGMGEIIPQGDLGGVYLTGVCLKSSRGKSQPSLLVSSDDDNVIHELDFKGLQLSQFSPPLKQPRFTGIEGIVEVPTGEIAAVNAFAGILEIFSPTEVPLPQAVDYRIGLGLSLPTGLVWDPTAKEFLTICVDRSQPVDHFIARVSPQFDSFRLSQRVDPLTRRVTYLADEHLIAVTHASNPRGILLFTEQGQPAGTIDTTNLGAGPPVVLSYLPTTREFLLVFRNQQKQYLLTRLNRDGSVSRPPIDFSRAGIQRITAITFFNARPPLGGEFLVFDNTQDLFVVTDAAGAKTGQAFSIRNTLQVLNPTAVTYITTGPHTGAFAICNAENSEVVVFRLD